MIKRKFFFDGRGLSFGNQKIVAFDYPIGEVLDYPETLVVRLDPTPGSEFNENVFGIGWDGEKIWQIRPLPHVYADSPYTKIYRSGNNVGLNNWDGLDVLVDPKSGSVLKITIKK